MIIPQEVLARIRDGSVSLAFRRWTRPTVRSGGTLMTHIGQLQIVSAEVVDRDAITEDDARRAGYDSIDDVLRDLDQRENGAIYRVELGGIAPDPRIALRASLPDEVELSTLQDKLRKLDSRSKEGPWTEAALRLIGEKPGVLAAGLARELGMENLEFKTRVRKLKELGLTISLEVGYRLSPRGELVVRYLDRIGSGDSRGRS